MEADEYSQVGAIKARSVVDGHLTDDDIRHKTETRAIIGGLDTMSGGQLVKRSGTIVDVPDNTEDNYGL